ncbi:MAG: condensation domain-containing protein, partial [Planctomycetota bacterium]
MSSVPGPSRALASERQEVTSAEIALGAIQSRLWTGQQLAGDAPLYRMALSFRIAGALDPERLAQAYELLVAERDVLRSSIEEDASGRLSWKVSDHGEPLLLVEGLPSVEAAEAWCQARVSQPFDPAAPLIETALLSVEENAHVLYMAQHHVIADAWSSALGFERLSDLYAGLEQGESAAALAKSLPAGRQYAEYLSHEKRFAATDSSVRARAYWEDVHNGEGPPTAGLYGDPGAERGQDRS